jgi:hypothetical protein
MKLKSNLYEKEQSDILNRLIDILQIDNNSTIILYELDNDGAKQTQIIDLIPNIRKYFSLSNVRGIKNPETLKRPWLSVMRHMLKSKYKMISKDHQITKDGQKIRTKRYLFIKQ